MALDLTSDENKAELQKLVQSETDKVRTKYSTEMKGLQDQLTQLQTAQMSATQKAEYELKAREDALVQKEAKILEKELDSSTKDLITSKGLNENLSVLLTATTIEGRTAQLDVLVKTMNLEVKEVVKQKFGQDAPEQSNSKTKNGGYDWNKMSYSDKVALYQKDQKLYEQVRDTSQK
jgi:hypothetical protein